MYQKLVKDLYLVLVNNLTYNWHIQEIVVNKILKDLLKIFKKIILIFLPIQFFMVIVMKSKRDLKLDISPFLGSQICSKVFFLQ